MLAIQQNSSSLTCSNTSIAVKVESLTRSIFVAPIVKTLSTQPPSESRRPRGACGRWLRPTAPARCTGEHGRASPHRPASRPSLRHAAPGGLLLGYSSIGRGTHPDLGGLALTSWGLVLATGVLLSEERYQSSCPPRQLAETLAGLHFVAFAILMLKRCVELIL